jgi:hypothetical protein
MAVEIVSPAVDTAPRPGDAISPRRVRPVLIWAVIGAVLLAFEVFVLARWVTGPNLTATKPGPDPLASGSKTLFLILQIVLPIAALVCLWAWVVRPWRREGRLTTDGMLALSGVMIFFWDMGMNFTSVSLLYNSHLLNLGAWASGSWPGWGSPNSNLLPEPLLITVPGYTCLVFAQVVLVLFLLRKFTARFPRTGPIGKVVFIVIGLTIIDTIIESTILRTGVYAYPGGIRSITLFAGHTYQVPMSETFLFGGLALGAVACLSHFRDDHGRTIVERGLGRVNSGVKRRQGIKFLAIFGAMHLAFFAFYFIPQQWFATHADAYPHGYKSYMINGMCQYPGGHSVPQTRGVPGVPCAGPGVSIPRSRSTL